MAQFDVHRNKGTQKSAIPYFLIVQSRRFDQFGRRVVIPLVDSKLNPNAEPTLNPVVEVEGRAVVLHTLQLTSLSLGQLGEYVCSLESEGDRIIAAIDMLISRAWH